MADGMRTAEIEGLLSGGFESVPMRRSWWKCMAMVCSLIMAVAAMYMLKGQTNEMVVPPPLDKTAVPSQLDKTAVPPQVDKTAVPSSCEWVSVGEFAGKVLCGNRTCLPEGVSEVLEQRCLTEGYRAVRIGPLRMHPGGWMVFWTRSHDALNWMLPAGMQITSFKSGAVTMEGVDIGYPPMHIHHVHVHRTRSSTEGNEPRCEAKDIWEATANGTRPFVSSDCNVHFAETHGDFATGPDYGVGAESSEGYRRRLPAGYCLVVPHGSNLLFHGIFNDVRSAGAAYDFFIHLDVTHRQADAELGAGTARRGAAATPPCKRAAQLNLLSPGRFILEGTGVDHEPARGFSPVEVSLADPWQFHGINHDSITWFTLRMPVAGHLLSGGQWLHMHRVRALHLIVQRGPPSSALCRAAAGQDHSRPRRFASGRPDALEAVYHELVSDTSTMCHDDRAVPTNVTIEADAELPPMSSYDRQGAVLCRQYEWAADEEVTIIALFRSRWARDIELIGMHVAFFTFADMGDAPEQDWLLIAPTLNPQCAAE